MSTSGKSPVFGSGIRRFESCHPSLFFLMMPFIPYNLYSRYLKNKFGTTVKRITLDATFTCPNRDGSITNGGCIYCSNEAFSPNGGKLATIKSQIDKRLNFLKEIDEYKDREYFAYFQSYSATYDNVNKLENIYSQATSHSDINGLIIGTRPDCIDEEKIKMIADFQKDNYVSMEYGAQSFKKKSLDLINRGHGVDEIYKAIELTAKYNIDISIHIIIGLPEETRDDILKNAEIISKLPIKFLKIHNLHVCRNTVLEEMYNTNKIKIMDMDPYISILTDFLERIPKEVVIQRISGDAPSKYLIAPTWSKHKTTIIGKLIKEFKRRGTVQGSKVK